VDVTTEKNTIKNKAIQKENTLYTRSFMDVTKNLQYDDILITTFVSFLLLYPEKRIDL